MNNIQSQPTFTGTFVRKSNIPIDKLAKKFENYFDLVPLRTSAKPADVLSLTQAGIQKTKDGVKFVGKDKQSDKMIFHLLKKFDKFGKYEYVEEALPESAKISTIA